jgi:predicted ATPase
MGARLESAIAWADRHGEGWYQAELMRLKGELMLQQSKGLAKASAPVSRPQAPAGHRRTATGYARPNSEAEDCFLAANDVARQQGALFWELRIAVSLARLRITQGRHDEVRELLAPVYDRFTEGFDTPLLRAARTLLGEQSA